MKDPIEWYNEKIKTLTEKKDNLQKLKEKIALLESQVEALKNKTSYCNMDVTFDLEMLGNDDEKCKELSILLDKEEYKDIIDDVRLLLIYSMQKHIGKLKKEYDSYSPTTLDKFWNMIVPVTGNQ